MQGCKVIFRGVFTRENAQLLETFWEIFQYLFFLLHSEKVRELVFQSSDRVKEKEKDSICHCIVSFPRAEKKFCKKTAYRSRHVSFHILSWLSCGYWISIMGKFLASNSEKDIDIQCNWLTLAPRITNNQNKNSLVMAKDFIWKYKLWVWRNTTQHHCIKRFFYSHTVLAGECRM